MKFHDWDLCTVPSGQLGVGIDINLVNSKPPMLLVLFEQLDSLVATAALSAGVNGEGQVLGAGLGSEDARKKRCHEHLDIFPVVSSPKPI
jgi:hypothetical protein